MGVLDSLASSALGAGQTAGLGEAVLGMLQNGRPGFIMHGDLSLIPLLILARGQNLPVITIGAMAAMDYF